MSHDDSDSELWWAELESKSKTNFHDLVRFCERSAPRYDPKYGTCPSCDLGFTCLVPLSGVVWGLCRVCWMRRLVGPDVFNAPTLWEMVDGLSYEERFGLVGSFDSLDIHEGEMLMLSADENVATTVHETADERIARLIKSKEPLNSLENWNVIMRGRDELQRREAHEAQDARKAEEQADADRDLREHGPARLAGENREQSARRVRLAEVCKPGWLYQVRPDVFVAAAEVSRRLRLGCDFAAYYPIVNARAVWHSQVAK